MSNRHDDMTIYVENTSPEQHQKKPPGGIEGWGADLDPKDRTATYQKAAKIVAHEVAVVPLYAPPQILIHKTAVKGMDESNNPTLAGPTWNVEQWHW